MTSADEAAIEGVVLDYFESWFEGDAARMERALHPELAKRCLGGDQRWWGQGKEADAQHLDSTSAREMIEATAGGVGKTRLSEGADPRIEVKIEDVYDTIANVTVRSAIYREYVHLIRMRQGWKIVNTVWQRTTA